MAAGYIDIFNINDRTRYSQLYKHIPENSVISPLLTNLYFTPLDIFVEDFLYSKHSHLMFDYKRLLVQKKYKVKSHLGHTLKKQVKLSSKKIIIHYLRNMDDCLFGFTGLIRRARSFRNRILSFLEKHLKIMSNKRESSIQHVFYSFVFLNTQIC